MGSNPASKVIYILTNSVTHLILLITHLDAHHLVAERAVDVFAATLHGGIIWRVHCIDSQPLVVT